MHNRGKRGQRCRQPAGTVAAAIRARESSLSERQGAPDELHHTVVQYLSRRKLKSGSVFGSSLQGVLEEMQRYASEIEATREELAAIGCAQREADRKEPAPLTDEEIERLAHKQGLNTIVRAKVWLTSLVPTPSVHADVRAHVEQRRDARKHDTALLCNYGASGSGKSVQLLHLTAVAIEVIEGMLRRGVNNDAQQERYRPLGFYISFTRHDDTSGHADSGRLTPPGGQLLILTAIALRMAFSVMEKGDDYRPFAFKMIEKCDMTDDKGNFDSIIAALRQVLKWEGPMFIAVDSILRAYDHEATAIAAGLSTVCRKLLDESPLLPISSSEETGPVIYERYLAISSFYPVHAVDFAAKTNRRLIMQPTALLDLRDIAKAFAHGTEVINVPPQYATLFASGHVGLTNEQLLFLIHLALSTGLPQEVSTCLHQHTYDVPGKEFGELNRFVTHMLWLREGRHKFTPITEDACVFACELVVGLEATNIFVGDDSDRRAFALSERLEWDCFVSQASPTRALVSPYFLSTVKASWPASGTNLSIRHHVVNLRMTISNHAEMAFNLLAAAPYLVKFPNEELSQRLVQHWISTTAVALGDLSFRALCLRFALSTKNGATGGRLLGGVCSRMDCVTGVLPDVQFCSGPLVVVSNIGVCPREFPYDAYYPYDDVGARIFSNEERYEMKTLLHACLQTAGPLHTCGTLHTHKRSPSQGCGRNDTLGTSTGGTGKSPE